MMKEDQLLLMDRYEILGTIRRGPAATASLAYDRRLGRRVVLKAIPLPSNGFMVVREAARRLVTEVRMASALSHPNIVSVLDVADDDEGVYVAMELIDAPSLAFRLRDEGPLSLAAALGIVDQVTSALAYAHAHGVLHGSLTPSNVLTLPDGRVRLGDFGLAGRAAEVRRLRAPGYLAPEQVQGRAVGESTDVWGLGVLMYEMLTGRPPFEGESAEACAHVLREAPPPPRSLRPDIPRAIENVILTCLEKEPALRFPSMGAFAATLERAKPLPPRPQASPTEAAVPPKRRRPPQMPLLAVLFLLLSLVWLAWSTMAPADAPAGAGASLSLPAARAPLR